MKVCITGQNGFIGRNLVKAVSDWPSLDYVPLLYEDGGEVDILDVDLVEMFEGVDVVVHNAAIVGTDVVNLQGGLATKVNVIGTQHVVECANAVGARVVLIGTTAAYDVEKYQEKWLTEDSAQNPTSLYGIQKFAQEMIVKRLAKRWQIVRPLFCFGGEGDMNSLIAKVVYGSLFAPDTPVHMHLDPTMYKDWLYVTDFCDAVCIAICQGAEGDHWNVSRETPRTPFEVVDAIQYELRRHTGYELCEIVWHPEHDYMGNHRLDSSKFRHQFNWTPSVPFPDGLKFAIESISKSTDSQYNPLKWMKQIYGSR